MDQARVTDYFRSCKRQNIYTNKQLNSSKVKALCDENVEALYKSQSNIDYVSYLKDDLQLKKSTIRKDGKSLLPKKPTILGLVCEAGTESLLELESTPKSRKLNDTVNSTPVLLNSNRSTRSSKLKKQKLKNENLLKTPSTPSFVHNNKPVSQTIRKRLLLQEDCQASSSRCKILKFENSEENVEECSEKDIDANFILKNEVVNEEGSSDINLNEGEKNASVISSSNKNTCQTSFHIDKDRKLTSLDVAELPNKINDKRTNFNDTKEGKEAETEVKVHLTNYKNNLKSGDTSKTRSVQPLIAPVAQKQSKDVSFGSVKEGKLKEIQEKLSKLSSLKAKLKVTQEKSSELKEKNRIETPAFQKYHYLASSSSKSLILPYKYKSLELCFQSCDRAVSFLHNRHEVCTFSKLKHSVQEMTKRTFRKTHLGQIKSVFPEAYEFSLEKGLSILSTGGSSGDSLLTVIPNFDYGDNVTLDSVGPLCNLIPNTHIHVAQVSSTNRTSEKPFVAMNSTRLSERLRIFHNNLFERTNNYHEEFLSTLNPPVHVPREKVLRWHPRFPLDNVPDIPVAPLPEPLDNNHYPTAKDVLNLIKDKLEPKVENALQNVADEHKEIEVSAKQNQTELVQKGALKGISQALVDKIRAREVVRMQRIMTRQPDVEKRLEMILRFPELISILRNYFITLRRAAIALDDVSKKVSESYRSHLASENAQQHLYLMADLLPEWISIITISKGPFVKIDKNKDVKVVIEKINQLIKKES